MSLDDAASDYEPDVGNTCTTSYILVELMLVRFHNDLSQQHLKSRFDPILMKSRYLGLVCMLLLLWHVLSTSKIDLVFELAAQIPSFYLEEISKVSTPFNVRHGPVGEICPDSRSVMVLYPTIST